MSEAMKKSKTQMMRTKKKRRKKDLDQVRRQVLNTRKKWRQRCYGETGLNFKVENSLRKTLNQFAPTRQNNDDETNGITKNDGEEIRQRTLCDRLLPQPSIGIYRNAISGKQVQKKIAMSEKNGRQQPGDVVKLLNGDGYLLKKFEGVRVCDENQLDSLKTTRESSHWITTIGDKCKRKSIDEEQEDQQVINIRMNTSCDTKSNKSKSRNFPSKESWRVTPTRSDIENNQSERLEHLTGEKNSEIQSVRRWRWSPVTCFEEFCAQLCIERFVNCPLDYFPAPGEKIAIFLRDTYAESNHSNCDFYVLCKESEKKSPIANCVEQRKSTARDFSYTSYSAIDDESQEWSRNYEMAHDRSTYRYENGNEKISKKRNNLTYFTEISNDFVQQNPEKMKSSVKCHDNLDAVNHNTSHQAIPLFSEKFNKHAPVLPSMADSQINQSLNNIHDKYDMIQTPSVIFRLIRHDKFLNVKSKNYENIGIDKDIFQDTADTFYNYDSHHYQHSYENDECLVENKLKDRSEKLKGLVRFSESNAPRESISRLPLHFKSNGINEWQHKTLLYNKKTDCFFKSNASAKEDAVASDLKVLPSHDDYYFNQANQRNENKKVKKQSKEMQQPIKYFAVENKYDIRNCPRRIAVYPHKYPYNSEGAPFSATTPSLLVADPLILFNPEKRKHKMECDTVNSRKGRDKPSELWNTKQWINTPFQNDLSSSNYYKNYRSDTDRPLLNHATHRQFLFDNINNYYY
ncbi:uncharacterized protein LOC107043914 [Diachasma alloeum]|uniref:uncharacterized protein LOC107043914 n=1 Tax=Diachasma alloeum TaxID=454923 RepID=UPI0007384CB4|nr:uncharacterized protein LOC107043914 [Diachasma alloeum]